MQTTAGELGEQLPGEFENGGDDGSAGDEEATGARPRRRPIAAGWLDRVRPQWQVRGVVRHLPVGVVIGYYVWYFSRLSVEVHRGYGTSGFDIGLYDQGVWLLSQFKAPFVTIMGRNLMGDHTSFIMVGLVPLYWLGGGASTLLVVQAIVLALGAVPVYLLALRRIGSVTVATLLAAAFLLHPALGQTNLENYHPDSFLVLFVGMALYAAVEDRRRLFIASSVLSLLVKEDVVLIILPIALWYAIRRRRRTGVAIALGSILAALVATQVVMKGLIGKPTLNQWRIPFGGVRGSIETLLERPGKWVDHLRADKRLWYVWKMLSPSAFVFLLRPDVTATGILLFTSNIVSTFGYQHLIEYHYSMALLPVIALGTVWAVAALANRRQRNTAVALVITCSLWTCLLWGLWPFSVRTYPHWSPSFPAVAQINEVKAQLPRDAVVSSWHSYIPHISHRERVYLWPTPFRAAYWGTFDKEGTRLDFADEIEYLMLPTRLDEAALQVFLPIRSQFELVAGNESATLYRRIAARP